MSDCPQKISLGSHMGISIREKITDLGYLRWLSTLQVQPDATHHL